MITKMSYTYNNGIANTLSEIYNTICWTANMYFYILDIVFGDKSVFAFWAIVFESYRFVVELCVFLFWAGLISDLGVPGFSFWRTRFQFGAAGFQFWAAGFLC